MTTTSTTTDTRRYLLATLKGQVPIDGGDLDGPAPAVSHVWGYLRGGMGMSGDRAYVLHIPASTHTLPAWGTYRERTITRAERWLVINRRGEAACMNTAAARLYLRTERDGKGAPLYDATGNARDWHDRILWELNR